MALLMRTRLIPGIYGIIVLLLRADAHAVRLKDLVDVAGFRKNPITGLGLVVGLAGTGDMQSSNMTRRPMAALLRHLGNTIDPSEIQARNVAVVSSTMAVGLARFVVDVAQEGVEAFDDLGHHIEKKLEELDDD